MIDIILDENGTVKVNEVSRDQFRMHPGGRSEGCITLTSKNDFEELSNILKNTKTAFIPGTRITYFGTMRVY